MQKLSDIPNCYSADEYSEDGVKAVFIDGPIYNNKPTKIFAFYGLPENQGDKKCPGMVLVHGGKGTAFAEWVRIWNRRGYAAIAIDTTGCVNENGKRVRHDEGGPDGWGSFDQMKTEDLENVWTYQAVAQIIMANSFLRSIECVDENKIGVTGISWGGYLICIAATVDNRFRIAIPVYGCGFLYMGTGLFDNLDKDIEKKWIESCDPCIYLESAKMPFLWINGTVDHAFTLNATQSSYRLTKGERKISIHNPLEHGHEPGWSICEIYDFADSYIKNKESDMVVISCQGRDGRRAWVDFADTVKPEKAVLVYTEDDSPNWKQLEWTESPATIENNRVFCQVSEDVAVYFFNLYSKSGLVSSSEHVVLNKKEEKDRLCTSVNKLSWSKYLS